jgi:hypothetical protein
LCNDLTRTCREVRKLSISCNTKKTKRTERPGPERDTFGEVECERRLVCPQVVYMENELFRQIFLAPPNYPTNTSVDKAILVPTDIDALH